MTNQSNAQRLNAKPPRLTGRTASASAPLVTPAVQRLIDEHPGGQEIYHSLAQSQHDHHQRFQIHHLDTGQNLIMREFDYENQAVIMTESESLNHYGPHRRHEPHQHHENNRSIGAGIASLGSSIGWTIFLTALIIAVTLDCHPEFLDILK